MKILENIPYSNIKIKFIYKCNDIHIKGICLYKNKLRLFIISEDFMDENCNKWHQLHANIYKLSIIKRFFYNLSKIHIFKKKYV